MTMSRLATVSLAAPLLVLLGGQQQHRHVQGFPIVSAPNHNSLDRFLIGTAALPKVPDAPQLLDAAVERGFKSFDLARTYGGGESEKIFGKWLDGRSDKHTLRDDLFVITKGGMGEDKYGDPNRTILTRESLHKEMKTSLTSLKLEEVDLYMLHRDDPRVEAGVIVQWMNELIHEGSTKTWGVSNWPQHRIAAAIHYANENNLAPPTTNSPQLSLAVPQREVWPTTVSVSGPNEKDAVDWYATHDINLYCWEVLAKGFMAVPDLWEASTVDEEFLKSETVELGTDDWRLQRIQGAYCHSANYKRRKIASQMAKLHDLSLAQISTLYALGRGEHVHVIVGVDRVEHLDELLQLRNKKMDPEVVHRLTELGRDIEIFKEDVPTFWQMMSWGVRDMPRPSVEGKDLLLLPN
jgi:aryl-alcohol dehydrogenase-like predicted oxidoreductase